MTKFPFARLLKLIGLLLISINFLISSSCRTTWAAKAGYDLQDVESVYIGWIDLDEEMWGYHEYETKEDWSDTIARLNSAFVAKMKRAYLPAHRISGASSNEDAPEAGYDIQILFSDAEIDYLDKTLTLTLTFVDGLSKKVLFEIPNEGFYCHRFGLEQVLECSLDKLGERLSDELKSTASPETGPLDTKHGL